MLDRSRYDNIKTFLRNYYVYKAVGDFPKMTKIEEMINSIPDDRYRVTVYLNCIGELCLHSVAYKIHYSWRSSERFFQRGIQWLVDNYKDFP